MKRNNVTSNYSKTKNKAWRRAGENPVLHKFSCWFAAPSGLFLQTNSFMRTNKNNSRRPETRSLKIQPKTRFNKYSQKDVPEIKLCGQWLEHLGFQHGTRVMVTTMPQLLIIRPTEKY